MAIGDVVGAITQIADAGSMTFQPAAGVEVIITSVGYNANTSPANTGFGMYDGSNYVEGQLAGTMILPSTGLNGQVKIFVTNSVYLRARNDSGGALNFQYTGITINV